MENLRYEAPETVDAAVALLAESKGLAKVLAGGTDLLVQLRADMVEPGLIVDIKKIPETRVITEENGGFRVGAAVTGAELGEHPKLKSAWPGVVEAVELIGSYQVQGRASLGGNLCNASPGADSVPAVIAARAVVRVAGPNGVREIPVEDVCTGPGKTSLAKGEFITSFFFPARPAKASDAYLRFIPRTEMDIAVVGAGINLVFDDGGTCTEAHVVLGAVGPTAIIVPDGAKALVGTKVDDAALAKLAEACSKAAKPISDKRGTKEFRTHVSGVIAKRTAVIARDRALG